MFARKTTLLATAALGLCLAFLYLGTTSEAQDASKTKATGAIAKADRKTRSGRVPESQLSAVIDREIEKLMKRDKVKASPRSSDEEFLRRVYLDTVGVPPTYKEATAFLGDDSKDKRARLISSLIGEERFGRHMANIWSGILAGRTRDASGSAHLFSIWMADNVNGNVSFRDVVYDILIAKGKLSDEPTIAVYLAVGKQSRPSNFAGVLTQKLTGIQIQCAQCHDHPYESWTMTDFAGIASFFAPVSIRTNNSVLPRDPSLFDSPAPPKRLLEQFRDKPDLPFDTKRRVKELLAFNKPVTLDGQRTRIRDRSFWRPALAKWMTTKSRQTPRYMVNRFWSFAMGSGFVNPVDNFTSANYPSHEDLLEELTSDFIESDWDIKRLYRAILNSRTYQRSSRGADSKARAWHFASYPVRQLSNEQLFGAMITVGGGERVFGRQAKKMRGFGNRIRRQAKQAEANRKAGKKPKENKRKVSYDMVSLEKFEKQLERMSTFWLAQRTLAMNHAKIGIDDGSGQKSGYIQSIDQVLAEMNGKFQASLTAARRGSLLGEVMSTFGGDEERIATLYMTVLSRKPTKQESKDIAAYVKETGDLRTAFEDLLAMLLESTEFQTNH